MKRTSHIAVRVPPERAEEATRFYSDLFGLERKGGDGGLFGENFVLWVDSSDNHHVALQEYSGGNVTKEQFIEQGCEVFDESPQGFHVRDPFGLSFHVWTNKDEDPD